ncbi:MAG: hypothetical protein PHE50_05420 [Dehalococcoidales bacterium]|nr:hypothetical protein [Dehalococcoidales bacterium]
MKRAITCIFTGFAIFLLLLGTVSCTLDHKNDNTVYPADDFAIYFLADTPENNVYPLNDTDLSTLNLASTPWITLNDIDYYDFSTHYIYLKNAESNLKFDPKKSFVYPFVVVAGGERCYLGHVVHIASSSLALTPMIYYPGFLPADILEIRRNGLDGTIDARNDPRVIEALINSGKCRAGLSVTLNEVKIVERTVIDTLSYTFTVTNRENRTLWVPDPVKMGSYNFCYYTGGIYLKSATGQYISKNSYSILGSSSTILVWDRDWFTRLEAGQSMKRTMIETGFSPIFHGVYTCIFGYSGPQDIELSERRIGEEQIWLGTVAASKIVVQLEY